MRSPDGKRELVVHQHDNGLFSFSERFEDSEDMTVYGYGVQTFWSSAFVSGLYETAEAAERDARLTIGWLRGDAD